MFDSSNSIIMIHYIHIILSPTKFEKNIFRVESAVNNDHLEFETVAMRLCKYCSLFITTDR